MFDSTNTSIKGKPGRKRVADEKRIAVWMLKGQMTPAEISKALDICVAKVYEFLRYPPEPLINEKARLSTTETGPCHSEAAATNAPNSDAL